MNKLLRALCGLVVVLGSGGETIIMKPGGTDIGNVAPPVLPAKTATKGKDEWV